jgi:uncharacterized protein YjbI with pentapeptide repeats
VADEWESAWREEDFSWAGLARRSLGTTSDGPTLQDYWRRGPGSDREDDPRADDEIDRAMQASGEIVADTGGILWHLAHAPVDGTVPKKLTAKGRAKTATLLKRRLLAASRPASGSAIPPAQLQGVRTTSAIDADGIIFAAFNAAWCDFAPGSSFHLASVPPCCTFKRARFGDRCSFKTRFGANTSFDHAIFGDRCSFDGATFDRGASFGNATFGMIARFIGAQFDHDADFSHATFGPYAVFDQSTFGGGAFFTGTRFRPGLSFEHATFEGADFSAAIFDKNASFARATFRRTVDFGADASSFDAAERAPGEVSDISFHGAVFGADASFANRLFRGAAVFDRTVWRGAPLFHGCTARQGISFSGAIFPCLERADWDYDWETYEANLIDLTGYARRAEFLAARQMRLDAMEPPLDPRWLRAWRRKRQRWTDVEVRATGHDSFEKLRHDDKRGLERRYADMERAFRTLKLLMENGRSKTEEARFFRLELVARRRRFNRRMVSRSEIFFSYLYSFFSNYGESLLRPLFGLALNVVVSTLFLFWISVSTSIPTSWQTRIVSSTSLAAKNAFQPFSIWSAAEGDASALPAPLRREEAFVHEMLTRALWPTRLIATAESIFAIAMIFLLLLALRRRFQIT